MMSTWPWVLRILDHSCTTETSCRCVGRGGGCVGCDRTPPPPTGRKGPPGSNLFGWKCELVKKNVKVDLSLYPVFFSAVHRLELCSCYWFICWDAQTTKGLVHPSKQSNNEVLQRVLLTIHRKQSSEHRLLFCIIHVTFLIQITRQLGNPLSPSQQGCTHYWTTVYCSLL